jgi:hypothetical protein
MSRGTVVVVERALRVVVDGLPIPARLDVSLGDELSSTA